MIVGIDDIGMFKVFFDVVFEECDTVELKCNPSAMELSLLDKSHTCFYSIRYDSSFFDLYDVDDVEIVSLFIEDVVKILKTASKNDYLTLSSDESRVVAKFEHENNTRVFELVQPADFGDSPTPPSIGTSCDVRFSIDDLNQSLKDFDIFKSGSCHLCCEDGLLSFTSKSDASMKYSHKIECEASGVGDAYYTVDYLKKLIKFKTIDKNIVFEFGDTLPLCWTVENQCVKVSGLIAPRIETD